VTSVYITRRETKDSGPRYVVRYRLGGRGTKLEHAGSFKTQREARIRRDLVAGELAAGRDPRPALRVIPAETRDYREWAKAYKASRVDLSDRTARGVNAHLKRLLPFFGERDPRTITVGDTQEWIGINADLTPATLRRYLSTHRLILDFADVEPNPARDRRLKLPTSDHVEVSPPTAGHLLALLDVTPARWRLPLIVIEQTGMTVGEIEALSWGDVDESGCQFRLRRRTVKAQIAARARWVQVPAWLMGYVSELCPVDDRAADRQVFQRFNADSAWGVMDRACRTAKIPHYHPHDLRHRRGSLWHGQGIPAKLLAERLGHSRASTSLDVYSHVMPLDEVPQEAFEALLVRFP
jgi:integrase